MSAVTTSSDSVSKRPAKKSRPTTAIGQQQHAVEALFAKQPEIHMPTATTKAHKTVADLAAPPEIVANVQGSSAGAGSGEFHVYKAARRREYERQRLMDDEAKREDLDKEWRDSQEKNKERDEAKTSKNRKRREKARANKAKKDDQFEDVEKSSTTAKAGKKAGLQANTASTAASLTRDGYHEDAAPLPDEQGIQLADDD